METETDPRVAMELLQVHQHPSHTRHLRDSYKHNMITVASLDVSATVPRRAPSLLVLNNILARSFQEVASPARQAEASVEPNGTLPATNVFSTAPSRSFTFDTSARRTDLFSFDHPDHELSRGIKRLRLGQDVDGPNTAGLCCKKRRLRADLIISRLSQSFSQPATHILNREGMKCGDKRFLKMATSIDTGRRIAHQHATSFRRFSIMNSLRKRLGVGRFGNPRGSVSQAAPARELDATARAPSNPQSLQVATGATYWRPSGVSAINLGGSPGTLVTDRPPHHGPKSTTLSVPRVSKPAALPMPSADFAATKERTSPRIHAVRSPESHSSPGTSLDDGEEDSFAFLHLGYDDYGDDADDPEHVYSDFGAIFRGSSPDSQPTEDTSYEEYLDELDGISWVT